MSPIISPRPKRTVPASCTFDECQPLLSPHGSTSTPSLPPETTSQQPPDDDHSSQHAQLRISNSYFKVIAVMTCFFITGIHATAIGALVPTLEQFYRINDSTTAFIFPIGVAGYVAASLLMPKVVSLSGWRGVALMSPMLHLTSTLLLSIGPPFPVVLTGFFVGGLGTGLSDSGFCSWASKRPGANVVQGFMHGFFSIGCVLGPILTVAILKQYLEWFVFYRMTVILACIELVVLGAAFHNETLETFHVDQDSHSQSKTEGSPRVKLVLICSIFFFFYLSIEASFSNWIVTYMNRVLHVDLVTASLSSSVFWIGMALGRSVLGIVTERFGLGVSVATYITLSACLQVIFKLNRNVPTSLVLLGTIGFFLGPMFPSGILLLASRLPLQEAIGAVGAAAAMGQVGGAAAPLAIGFMADKLGMDHLPDVVLGLSILLLGVWLGFAQCI